MAQSQSQLSLASLPGASALLDLAGGRVGRAMLSWSGTPASPYPEIESDLASLETWAAEFDPEKLEFSPFGSLGAKCWAFHKTFRLRPLELRRNFKATEPSSILAARRILLHDALHVLLGFDPDPAGELGVFSFVAAQRYSPRYDREARELGQLYMTIAPWLREELQAAEYRGRELAAAAPRLLMLPLEREWNTPLTPLQARLKLRTLRTLAPVTWTKQQPPA